MILSKKPRMTDKICKEFGCGRYLNAHELMYSDYCFKHQRLINQNEMKIKYAAILYRWDNNNKIWGSLRTIVITEDQYLLHLNDIQVREPEFLFYKYHLMRNHKYVGTLYNISPSLFEK